LQCVAVCCSVLQCVAVSCSVLQCLAVCCSVLQCLAVCCSVLQCVAANGACHTYEQTGAVDAVLVGLKDSNVNVRSVRIDNITCCNVLQSVAECFSVFLVCCSILQSVCACVCACVSVYEELCISFSIECVFLFCFLSLFYSLVSSLSYPPTPPTPPHT